jgi:hypothetical protein
MILRLGWLVTGTPPRHIIGIPGNRNIKWNDIMTNEIRRLLKIAIVAGLIGAGCDELKWPVKEAPRQLGPPVQKAQWGPDVEGVQCRIRPIKRLWAANEPLVFRVDFRNRGTRTFGILDDGAIHAERILLDGRWYSRPLLGMTGGKPRMLGPGEHLDGLSLCVSRDMAIPFEPGPHTIQVMFLLEGLEILSNPVDFEIASR